MESLVFVGENEVLPPLLNYRSFSDLLIFFIHQYILVYVYMYRKIYKSKKAIIRRE
jgi:hypothetical protein